MKPISMKRPLCFLLAFLLSFCIIPQTVPLSAGTRQAASLNENELYIQPSARMRESPAKQAASLNENELYARSAVLMDADSGRVLFGKDAQNPMPMASTTKIMTCILTLEHATLDDVVPVSAYAAKMPDVQLHISQGEHYRLEDLLYSLMLESHNDSAVAIAEHVGGSVEGFAQMMNEKAQSIGCTDTFFLTPNGLDASAAVEQPDGTTATKVHSTTAADLARILSYCIKRSPQKETFLNITRTASHSFCNLEVAKDGGVTQGARSFSCVNHNAFLHMMDGALTGKTGFTGNAGYCYVGALENGGRTFVIALLACGWPNHKTWKWKDAKKLFQYGMDHYRQVDITDYNYTAQPIPVENGAGDGRLLSTRVMLQPLVRQKEQTMLLSENDQVEIRAKLPETLQAPVQKGMRLGSLEYTVNGTCTARMPVYAPDGVAKRTLLWYFQLVLSRYFYPYLV